MLGLSAKREVLGLVYSSTSGPWDCEPWLPASGWAFAYAGITRRKAPKEHALQYNYRRSLPLGAILVWWPSLARCDVDADICGRLPLATASCFGPAAPLSQVLRRAGLSVQIRLGDGTAEARCAALSHLALVTARAHVSETGQAAVVVLGLDKDRVGAQCGRVYREICFQGADRQVSEVQSRLRVRRPKRRVFKGMSVVEAAGMGQGDLFT